MADPIFNVDNENIEPVSQQTGDIGMGVSFATPTSSVPTSRQSVQSSSDGYREGVAASDVALREETPHVSSTFSSTIQQTSSGSSGRASVTTTLETNMPPANTSLEMDSNTTSSQAVAPTTPSSTIPDTSVAAELRKHQDRSPIERGPAPHLQAIREGLEREKNLVRPEETVRKTIPGDPFFAPNLIKSQDKSPEEAAKDATRAEEAKRRGFEQAEEAGRKQPIKSLRTFQSDIADAMRSEHPSMIQSVLSEHHVKEEKEEEATYLKKKNTSFVVSAVVLIIIGLGAFGVGGWYWYTNTQSQQVAKTGLAVPALFSVDARKEISVDNLDSAHIHTSIKNTLLGTDLFIDSIVQIYLTENTPSATDGSPIKTVLSTQQFLSRTESTIPQWLMRTLDPVFMLGVHVWNGNQPFLIFSTSNDLFDNTFSGMLKWEPTLAKDILPLFGVTVGQDVYAKTWEDVVLKNRDVRALKDNGGNIILLYTFYDRKTLIITTSPDTMDEVIQRIIQTKR